MVYAVAVDGGRFYRVDTQVVPPGQPSYEIPVVEPGLYHVYTYPATDAAFGGGYTYLAACEAGHLPPPPEGCWENPDHNLVPVSVRAGQSVEEIDLFDWYSDVLPPPPRDTADWPIYTQDSLQYSIRYPPHWEVKSEDEWETTFGRPDVPDPLASVHVTEGSPEELSDAMIAALSPEKVISRQWQALAGRESLRLTLQRPGGEFTWWFVPRDGPDGRVYSLHAVTDSGLGSFDQMIETFTFVDTP